MRKQLGILASLLFLCATALLWTGCSDRCCDDATPIYDQQYYEPQYGMYQTAAYADTYGSDYTDAYRSMYPSYQESCPQPCPQVCPQPCPQVCPQPCPQPCPQACPEPCPQPCPQACPEPCPQPCPQECPRPCPQVCPQPCPLCPQACPEPCPPLGCKPLVRCRCPNQNELQCRDGIIVTARNPKMCLLGDQYPLEFDVRACDDVCDVVVTTTLPEGVSLVRSVPEARVEGRKVTWFFGPMNRGECRPAKVLLKCECEGELCACFCASALPVRFCSILCAKPILSCEKCGPEQVCPGDPIHYRITVTNSGSCAAEDVVVTDNLPDQVEHSSGLKTLTYKIGCLQPCESKTIDICVTAVKRGKICNTAVVSACNADSVSCQWCTCICCCMMECAKVGPKELHIGKNADYQIVVANTGDLPLTEVVVTDNAPPQTSIVSANGATIRGNQAVWRLKEMKPGEKATFNITLTTCTPGCFTNRVHVTNCQNCNGCCEFMTHWRGRPALNVCIADTEDPICIGDTTSYNISVVNQGSEADSNVAVVVTFPPEVQPTGVTGDSAGQISGQTVKFAPYQNLRPRQTIRYRIDAKGVKSGDARIKVEVSSEAIKNPIIQQESTIVN